MVAQCIPVLSMFGDVEPKSHKDGLIKSRDLAVCIWVINSKRLTPKRARNIAKNLLTSRDRLSERMYVVMPLGCAKNQRGYS